MKINWCRQYVLAAVMVLTLAPWAEAATKTLVWDYPSPPADLAGFRVYRGVAAACALVGTPLPAPIATVLKPIAGPLVLSYIDTAVPDNDGAVCYELTAYDTAGNESVRSIRAEVFINFQRPPVPTNLRIQP